MPRQKEHENRGENMRHDIQLIVNTLGKHAGLIQRHGISKEFEWIEEAGLHLANKRVARKPVWIPDRQNPAMQLSGSEMVPGVTLTYSFPLPQNGKLLREDKLPVEKRHCNDYEQHPPGGSHGQIVQD